MTLDDLNKPSYCEPPPFKQAEFKRNAIKYRIVLR